MHAGRFLFHRTVMFNDYSLYTQAGSSPSDISKNILSITNNGSTLSTQDVTIIVDLLAQLVESVAKGSKQVCLGVLKNLFTTMPFRCRKILYPFSITF